MSLWTYWRNRRPVRRQKRSTRKAKRDNRKEGAISLDVRIAEMLRRVSQILNEIYIHQHNILNLPWFLTVDENICQE